MTEEEQAVIDAAVAWADTPAGSHEEDGAADRLFISVASLRAAEALAERDDQRAARRMPQ